MDDQDDEDDGPIAFLGNGGGDSDDGYYEEIADEPQIVYRPDRKRKKQAQPDIEDEEALALRLLQGT